MKIFPLRGKKNLVTLKFENFHLFMYLYKLVLIVITLYISNFYQNLLFPNDSITCIMNYDC